MATYAFSDIHGNYNLWTAIKNYCKEDDTIYFLGDAIDRRPDGIKIMQEMFNDKRIIYIKGNHEDLLLSYIEIGIGTALKDRNESQLIKDNGSYDTVKDFQKLSYQEQKELKENIQNKTIIKDIYINKENKKIVLCHAGCNSNHINGEYPDRDYLWDRNHLQTKAKDWNKNYNDYIVIHGHTPVQYLSYFISDKSIKKKVYSYCGGHKIDIDMATFASNKIALINLDTFEIIYFIDKESK